MDEFGFYQEVYPVVLYIGDNPTVVTFHNDTVVEAIVIYNRPETAYPVRLWVEGKGAADGNVTFTYVNYFYELAPPAGSTEGGTHVTLRVAARSQKGFHSHLLPLPPRLLHQLAAERHVGRPRDRAAEDAADRRRHGAEHLVRRDVDVAEGLELAQLGG